MFVIFVFCVHESFMDGGKAEHGRTGPDTRQVKVRGPIPWPWPIPFKRSVGPDMLTSGLTRKLASKFKFWSVFGRFPAKLGPRTPLNRSGSTNGEERTSN